jgi:hypothetical protein
MLFMAVAVVTAIVAVDLRDFVNRPRAQRRSGVG